MMFRPRESFDQRLIEADLSIGPEPSQLRYVQDVFGNTVGIARFERRSHELTFESRLRLEHTPIAAFAGLEGETAAYHGQMPFSYSPEDMPDLLRSMERAHPDPGGEVERWARRFVQRNGPTSLQGLLTDMTHAIHSEFGYAKRLEGGAQTPLQTLKLKRGSCRDFAVLMMEAVRALGLAARFVSGYIYCPPGGRDSGYKGGGHTHAWVRVYLPVCGWVEFDPTNGIVGNAGLVRVAISRDPRQATPLHGAWMGLPSDSLGMDVEVEVDVERADGAQPVPRNSVAMAG